MKFLKSLFILFLLIMLMPGNSAFAQHEHHNKKKKEEKKDLEKKPAKKKQTPSKKDTTPPKADPHPDPEVWPSRYDTTPKRLRPIKDSAKYDAPPQNEAPVPVPVEIQEQDTIKSGHDEHKGHTPANMSHAFSLNLPMNRNGSGTGWLPDSTPLYGYMFHPGNWMLMLHGNIFLRYTATDVFKAGSRGDSKVSAPNWIMGMAQRRVGKKGLFMFRLMVSADPVTEGGNGYPLLYQSGETWQGKLLVDRQHPHDLISELALGYTHSFSEEVDVSAYLGYPGEPTLGPTAFMHRVSSLPIPDAPLGHHWQDATHILFGVGTLGLRYKILKAEASVFTGREPGENRYNFDEPRFDSYSFRLSLNPNAYWSFQASAAQIKSPEALEPDEDIQRTTFSIINSFPLGYKKHLNTSVVWGTNKKHEGHIEHAALLESALQMNRFTLYGRYEFVQKSTHELDLEQMFDYKELLFPVHALSLGFNQVFYRALKTNFALGAQASLYASPAELHELYGEFPVSAQVFIRIYPQQFFTGPSRANTIKKAGEHIGNDSGEEHRH